jgi:hypothetical protein
MNTCAVCRQNKAIANCGFCRVALCKTCEQYLAPESFAFQEKISDDFLQGHYCSPCYGEKVEPALIAYEAILTKARKIFIFFDTSPLPRSLIKKSNKGISIARCQDRDETFLRLGFKAAEKGFNAVVEVVVERTRLKNTWEGKGVPANINEAKQARFEWD